MLDHYHIYCGAVLDLLADLTKNECGRISPRTDNLKFQVFMTSSKVATNFIERAFEGGFQTKFHEGWFRSLLSIIGNLFMSPFLDKRTMEEGSHPNMLKCVDYLITLINIIKIEDLYVIYFYSFF